MDSNSKKHWPSLFKSKSTASSSNQMSGTSNSTSPMQPAIYSEGVSSQREKSPPKAKPRWIPKQEQIQILEDVFNSGTTNPSREQIQRIRIQLEEFGQIGDASVFYWFQNRKARSKHKKRQVQAIHKSKSKSAGAEVTDTPAYSSITSTSVQSKPDTPANYSLQNIIGDQPISSSVVPVTSFSGHHNDSQVNENMSINQHSNMQAAGLLNQGTRGMLQESIINANPLITVFINDMPFEIPMGPINFRAFFGDDALLLDASGHLLQVNEWGITLEGLQNGATYFLI